MMQPLTQLEPSGAIKVVGMYQELDGNMTTQVDALRQKADEWGGQIMLQLASLSPGPPCFDHHYLGLIDIPFTSMHPQCATVRQDTLHFVTSEDGCKLQFLLGLSSYSCFPPRFGSPTNPCQTTDRSSPTDSYAWGNQYNHGIPPMHFSGTSTTGGGHQHTIS